MATVLVINMGLKSIRAIIFNHAGIKLGSYGVPIKTAINENNVEQNPNEWREKLIEATRRAHYEAGCCNIDFITVTTSASCLICVDKNGDPIGNAFMVSDKRAFEETRYIERLPEYDEVYVNTGIKSTPSLMIPKILWVKNNRPEQFEQTSFFLAPNDFLISYLCGNYVTDYLNASKLHYDIKRGTYPIALLHRLGISETKLPEVKKTGEYVANISKDIAVKTGINSDAKVVLSTYDAICSFVGSGASDEGEASDVSGTVTVFRVAAKKGISLCNSKVYNLPFEQGGYDIVGGSNNLGGGLIEWVKQCYYQREEYPYEVMEKDAAESEIGAKGLVFLPYLLGERTPIWNENARGVFFGLERMHTRKDMTRAVFESTGFVCRDIVASLIEMGDIKVDTVRFSGGLARINLISQLKADILGKDILVLSEYETTSTGAAMIVLQSQGVFADLKTAANKFAIVRMIIKPNQDNHRKYEYIYELFKETYKAVEPLYIRRMEILYNLGGHQEIRIENL